MDFIPAWLELPLFGCLFIGGLIFILASPRKDNPRAQGFSFFSLRQTPDQIAKANTAFAVPLNKQELRRLGLSLAGPILAFGAIVVLSICLVVANFQVLGWVNFAMVAWIIGASWIWGRLTILWIRMLRDDPQAIAKLTRLMKLA